MGPTLSLLPPSAAFCWKKWNSAAKAAASGEDLDRVEGLDANYVSTQSILEREIAQNYTTAAQEYNQLAGSFPASLIAPLWGAGEAELFAAP